jgi:hypothetical protein
MRVSPTLPVIATAGGLLCFFIGLFPPALLTNLAESFPVTMRSGAIGFLYALAVAVFGGSTQYIVTWLIAVTQAPMAPAWYISGAMAVGLIGVLASRETAPVKQKH